MSRGGAPGPVRRVGFPRVSGDEPLVMIDEAWAFEFSPRERG